jgi:cytochrome P450 family 110
VADPLEFQDRHSRTYGDLFTMRLTGLGAVVVLGSPQAVQDIFSQDAKFDVGRGNGIAEPLVGRNSLMLMDGDRHRRERKLLTSRLLRGIPGSCSNKWSGMPGVA